VQLCGCTAPLQQIRLQHCTPHPAASGSCTPTPATLAPAAILRVQTDIGHSENLIAKDFRGGGWAWLKAVSQRSHTTAAYQLRPGGGRRPNNITILQQSIEYWSYIARMGTGTGCQYRLPQATRTLRGFGNSRSNAMWSQPAIAFADAYRMRGSMLHVAAAAPPAAIAAVC
jgi:hypothetical protein